MDNAKFKIVNVRRNGMTVHGPTRFNLRKDGDKLFIGESRVDLTGLSMYDLCRTLAARFPSIITKALPCDSTETVMAVQLTDLAMTTINKEALLTAEIPTKQVIVPGDGINMFSEAELAEHTITVV